MKMNCLTEPLFINIDIEYELDMGKFPGWEDTVLRTQPKLLIHQPGICSCFQVSNPEDYHSNLSSGCIALDTGFSRIADVPDVLCSWEAQLPPISIPSESPNFSSDISSCVSYRCSKKRKFSCLEEFPEDDSIEQQQKKIHLDNEELIRDDKIQIDIEELRDFLYFFVGHSFMDTNKSSARGDLCRCS